MELALARVDNGTLDRAAAAEQRAAEAEQKIAALREQVERLTGGLRRWVPEEEWDRY